MMRNTILKDIAGVREHITVQINAEFSIIKPYILQAEKYVRNIIGDELFELLVETANPTEESTLDENLVALLPYVQAPLINFAYYLAIDKLNVNVGNNGITVAQTNALVPASKERVDRLRESLYQSGMDLLEELLKFLEKNKETYPEWESSTAYSYNKKWFINNAADFYNASMKEISRIEFLDMRMEIELAEEAVKIAIGEDLFNEIKEEYRSGEVSEENQILLDKYILRAIGYGAYARKYNSQIIMSQADFKIKQLRDYLLRNKADYPLYTVESINNNYNSEENGFFTF